MPRSDEHYNYNCIICTYHTSLRRSMIRHIQAHKNFRARPYKCSQCVYTAPTSTRMREHMRVHTGEKPFKCSNCEFRTAYPSILKQHEVTCFDSDPPSPIKKEQKKELKLDYCIHCKEEFSGDIVEHCRQCPSKPKTDERYNYYCTMCTYHSRMRCTMVTHTYWHKDVRPYKCNHCNYAAKKKFRLQEHIRVHTKEKPFECVKCDRKFAYKFKLKEHIRDHCGEKP
ncbi:hypothetical protein WDU94_005528 [Cyamophila willieti]